MKIGFIGLGNMASAIIGGILKQGHFTENDIIGSAPTKSSRERTAEEFGIGVTADNQAIAADSDVLFLAVKPQVIESVIEEIRDCRKKDQMIISIIAGKSHDWFRKEFGENVKLIRTMPNTPALVGEAMTAVCPGDNISSEELDLAMNLLESFGKAEIIPEKLMDAVVAVSGSSPAYVFMMIEAMADEAVKEGMPRKQAYKFAAQAVYGSAKMVLETGKHPGELKDMVCSPAGTTIEAVRVLEKEGFRSAMIEAMAACADVNRRL